MEALFLALLLAALVALLVTPSIMDIIQREQQRRRVERERLLADIRLRQIAQAGFLSMVAEARRAQGGPRHGE